MDGRCSIGGAWRYASNVEVDKLLQLLPSPVTTGVQGRVLDAPDEFNSVVVPALDQVFGSTQAVVSISLAVAYGSLFP